MKEYFESKGDAGKFQVLLYLLKSNCLVVMGILGINMVRTSESDNHIVINLQYAFNAIGKTSRTKDICVAHRVLSESVVRKSTWQCRLLSHTSQILKLYNCSEVLYYKRKSADSSWKRLLGFCR